MKSIKALSLLSFVCLFVFTACKKENFKAGDVLSDMVNEGESLRVSNADYEITGQETLGAAVDCIYTEGTIQYTKDGVTIATVTYANDKKATVIKDGVEYEIDLEKEEEKKGGKGEWYKKVVIEPLVKADDCGNEIVSGIIKYFDLKSGEWLATVDFGDGTCDDLATKETKDDSTVFTVSDYF